MEEGNMKRVLEELEREGIHLLQGEELKRVLDLKEGLSEELNIKRRALVLTNRRLLYWERRRHRVAFLGDVPRIDLVREKRKLTNLIAGVALIAAGFGFWIWARGSFSTLGPATGILGPFTRLFAQVGTLGLAIFAILGLGFMIYYFFSGKEEIVVPFGGTEIKGPLPSGKMGDVSLFINEFFETKGAGKQG